MPVTPPHWLNIGRGIVARIDFGPSALTELLLNLLHTNLQRSGPIGLSRAGIGSGGDGGGNLYPTLIRR